MLAVLLLNANQPVSAERIAVALWGEDAPAGAVRTVHVNVSRLRKALGDGALLATTPAGYRLRVQPGELDAERFEELVADGRRALEHGQAEEAGIILRKALKLWRGPPLADLAFEPFAQVEIARLEEEQQAAVEARVEADLAAGRHAELVAELRRMVAKHPARERLAGHLMLALYRCGRQSEALEAYHEARRRLADELGIEPGDELRALHDAILQHDPALAKEPAETLPHELDVVAAPPLVGRRGELGWLHDRWHQARAGAGRLVVIAGDQGMGKTRLVAELAVDVHAHGATVLYASGAAGARAVFDLLDRMPGARHPLLVVVDDADAAGEHVLEAIRDAAGGATLIVATAKLPDKLEVLEPGGLLYLKQLDSTAVGEIAALYAPDRAAQEVPAEWLLGASGGVPRRVHDVASLWARREAARRVGAVAGRAAAGRSQLRSMEDELAGGVVQMQTLHEWRGGGDGDEQIVCPFKGLASFEAADAPYFFGRERLVAELVARLVGAPLLAVVGPSGSGKSSVVRAGLLPALAGGVLPGSQDWPQWLIRPGEHPLRQLETTLDQAGSQRFVLAVDQFEEAFTACRDTAERGKFFSELTGAAGGVVVLAMRADFYGRCSEYPELAHLIASNHVLVGPMQRDELQRAVECPAQRVGLAVEPELVEALVDDVEHAPGALPLLSTALLELWRDREGRRLQLASYERTGGVRGAVARLAEEAYGHLDGGQRELARTVLLQLVEVDDEGAVERRRRRLAELGSREDVERLLEVLAERRLVTISEGTVELAHEALLREWPRLRAWIEDEGEGLRIERSLRTASREWLRVGRDDGALYRGARLDEASEWSARNGHALPELEHEFLAASTARATRDRRARRRALTFVFASLAVGLVAIAVVAGIAINQRQTAERERDAATSRQLALQSASALQSDPELAVRLALSALDHARTDEAEVALRQATPEFRQRAVLRAAPSHATSVAYSPDGNQILTGAGNGIAILWNAATHAKLEEWRAGHRGITAARYSSGGDAIAFGFADGSVIVTDASLASPRALDAPGPRVESIAFTGDDASVVAGLHDGDVLVLPADGGPAGAPLSGHTGKVVGVAANADGTLVASAGVDGSVRLWSVSGGPAQVLRERGEPVWDVAFSPDGRLLMAVGDDGLIRRWNVSSGREGATVSGGGAQLFAVAFSGDGRRFAAAGEDGIIRVWALAGGPPVATLRGQAARIEDLGFGVGSRADQVASAGVDGAVRLWDTGHTLLWKAPGGLGGIDFTPDGRYIAAADGNGDLWVWDTRSGALANHLPSSGEYVTFEAAPKSDSLLIADPSTQDVPVWAIAQDSAAVAFRAPGHDGVATARFDAGEQRIVYADAKARLAVRTLRSGQDVVLDGGPKEIWDARFSPDGENVAISTPTGKIDVWRIASPAQPARELTGHRGGVSAIDYGADGRLVSAGADGTVRVWPARSGRALVMNAHTGGANDAAFWVDDRKVVSVGGDRTVQLRDAQTGRMLAVLETWPIIPYSMRVSPDGKIAVFDLDGYVHVFRCEVCGSLAQVERRAEALHPRALTPQERRLYPGAAD
ncbi:MAG TPA: BTAD domain-containing putative transcriptional regulator [Solirubrobacteraceae bacterium]|nr:BTAD domain-containing putative transcriptional regulator [Solirubrobacteraceae bacterium]